MTVRSQGIEDAEYFQLQGKSVEEGIYTFQGRMQPLQSLLQSGKMKIHTFFHTAQGTMKPESLFRCYGRDFKSLRNIHVVYLTVHLHRCGK